MYIKCCIFDLDGVIVDTAKYHYLAWKRIAELLGFEFTREQNEELKGVSRVKSLEILCDIGKVYLSEEETKKYLELKNRWYLEYIDKMPKEEILDGVSEFLLQLREKNIKLAIGSASKNAIRILNKLEILDCFDYIVDGTKVSKAKPDPEVFLLASKRLNIPPENCIVFEDAAAGVKAAKNANMFVVGIGKKENLPEANLVVDGIKDLNYEKLIEITK